MNNYCNTNKKAAADNSDDSNDHNSNSSTIPSDIINTGEVASTSVTTAGNKRKLPSTTLSTAKSKNNYDHNDQQTRDDEEKERDIDEIHLDDLQLDEKGEDRQKTLKYRDFRNTEFCTIASKWITIADEDTLDNMTQTKLHFEDLNKTPYLSKNKELREHIDKALKIVNDLVKLTENNNYNNNNDKRNNSKVSNDNLGTMTIDNIKQQYYKLTDKDKEVYDALNPKLQRQFLEERLRIEQEHQEEIKRKDQEKDLRGQYVKIIARLEDIQNRSQEVYFQLYELAGLSQAETTMTAQTKSTTTRQSKKMMLSEDTRRGYQPFEEKQFYCKLLNGIVDIGKAMEGLEDLSTTPEELKIVARHFDSFLSTATILRDEKEYRNLVLKGLEVLKDRMDNQSDHGSSLNDLKESWKAPGPTAYEKDGTQPYIKLLLEEIGRCCDSQLSQSSPAKNSVCSEVAIPPTSKRRKRIVDFLLQKEGRWQEVVLDDKLTIPFEVKPGSRKDSGPKKLLEEAREQCLSHLAKAVFVGFQFASYGVPCHATGIVANMAALQILHLKYEDVGTPTARLVLYQSEYLPLMSKTNYQIWYKPAPDSLKKSFQEFEEEIYGTSCTNQIPNGMVCLLNLMQKKSKELYGFDVDAKEESILDEPLGFGASSVVFRHKTEPTVVKLSRYGCGKDIEREREILHLLAQQKNDANSASFNHLAQIASEMDELEVELGSITTKLPALEIRPVGQRANLFVAKGEAEKKEGNLKIILTGMMSALKHLHDNNIIHGDVSPKNVIIVTDDNGEKRAVLIDFTISTNLNLKENRKVKGFQGTPNYVHGDVFLKFLCNSKTWKPSSDHDLAGLGLTLAYFANNCICPWNVGNYPRCISKVTENDVNSLKNVMKERRKRAERVFKDKVKNNKKLFNDLRGLLAKDLPEEKYSLKK